MRVGDFKQAIDLFKRLVKQDARTEWRDALAEAYAERARTLAAKGMFEEAEIALSKAAGPDGTIRDPLLYVQCLVKRGQVHKAAELAVKYVVNDKVLAATAPQLAELTAALWLVAPVPLAPPADQQSEGGKWIEHARVAHQTSDRVDRGQTAARDRPALEPHSVAIGVQGAAAEPQEFS